MSQGSRRRTILIGCGATVLSLAALGLIGFVGFTGWLSTAKGETWLVTRLVGALGPLLAPNGTLVIGDVRSDWTESVELRDVTILDAEGQPVISIARLAVDIDLARLLTKEVKLKVVRGDGVRVSMRQDAEGAIDLLHVMGLDGPSDPDAAPTSLPVDIVAPDVQLRGVHVSLVGPSGPVVVVSGLSLSTRVTAGGTEFAATDLELVGQLAAPGPTTLHLTGALRSAPEGLALDGLVLRIPDSTLAIDGTVGSALDLELGVRRLHLPSLDPLAGGAGLTGTVGGDLTVSGPMNDIRFAGRLQGQDGTHGILKIDGGVDTQATPLAFHATAELDALHVDAFLTAIDQPVILDGVAKIDGAGVSYPDDLRIDIGWEGGRQEFYGQHVDRLDADLHLENGKLTLTETRVDGIIGELVAAGELDLAGGPMSLRVTGTATPSRLAELGVEGVGTTGRLDATITGDLQHMDTEPIEVRGTIAWAPFRYQGDAVTFERVRAGYHARILGSAVSGEADVTATEGQAYGVATTQAEVPRVDFDITETQAVTVAGGVEVTEPHMADVFRADRTGGSWGLTLAGDALEVSAELQVGAHDWLTFPGTGGRLVVGLADDVASFAVELRDGARATLDLQGRFDTVAQQLTADRLVLHPTQRLRWEADEPVKLTLTDTGITDARVSLVGPQGNLSVDGTLGQQGPLDAWVRVEGLQLDALAEMFPDQATDLYGKLDTELRIEGTGAEPALSGSIKGEGIWAMEAVRWLDIDGTFVAAEDSFQPMLTLGVAGEPLARIDGIIPFELDLSGPGLLPDAELDASITLLPGQLQRFSHLSASELELPEGALGGVLEVTGPLRSPDLRLAGVAEVRVAQWDKPARIELDVGRAGQDVFGWADVREGMRLIANLGLSGVTRMDDVIAWQLAGGDEASAPDTSDYALWLDQMMVTGSLVGTDVDKLLVLGDLDPAMMDGQVGGGFTVMGSPWEPTIDLAFQVVEGKLGTVPLGAFYGSVTPVGVGLRVDAQATFETGGSLTIEGVVPLDLDLRTEVETWSTAPMVMAIGGDGVPLSVLTAFAPDLRRAEGVVKIGGRVGGRLHDPDPRITLSLSGGSLSYPPIGLNVDELDLEVVAERDRVVMSRFHAATDPIGIKVVKGITGAASELDQSSEINASASVGIVEGELGTVTGNVELVNGWVMATNDIKVRTHGDLAIQGTWPALSVTGDLAIRRGNVVLDAAAFLGKAPLQPDPALTIRRKGERATFTREEGPSFYQEFDVSVNVNLDRNVTLDLAMAWADDLGSLGTSVSRLDVNTRLDGRLTAGLRDGEPTLTGEVDLLSGGRVQVLASVLDIEESSITFTGADPTNPTLDINAEMELPNSTIRLAIDGTPSEPEIAFSSEEYPEQSDILTVLLTGRDLESSEDSDVASALANILADRLLSSAGLGAVSIEPDGSVKFRAPVSSRLFVETRLDPSPGLNEPSLMVEADWSLARGYVLTVGLAPGSTVNGQRGRLPSLGANGSWWTDLSWQIRF